MKPLTNADSDQLAQRIRKARDEAEAILDRRAAEMSEECPGIPLEALRQLMTARAPGCVCRQLEILRDQMKDA